MNKLPVRKSNRLKKYNYSQCGAYFITICTKNKELLFGEISAGKMMLNECGIIVDNEINNISSHYDYIEICHHVVMPNHVHLIIEICATAGAASGAPTDENPKAIGNVVRGYKSGISRLIGFSPWQRNYHDHIIRNEQEYIRIAEYIETNPEKWQYDKFYM